MDQAAKPTRQNRTITVDFQDEATYFQLLGDTQAFVEFVLAFLLSLGFQLLHKTSCSEGGSLTRHSHYARVRLGGLTIWRVQCTTCKAGSPSCRTSSCAIARCDLRWLARLCWPRMAASAWSGLRPSVI